jgi:hypothetical protein
VKPLEITPDSRTSGMPWSCGAVIVARDTLSPAGHQTLAAWKRIVLSRAGVLSYARQQWQACAEAIGSLGAGITAHPARSG